MIVFAPWLLVGLLGLCLGSYATTAGLRFARLDQSVFGRSRCDHCGGALGYGQTLPVISYLRLGGSCRACGGAIEPLHPIGEILGGVLAVAAFALATPVHAAIISALGLVLLTSSVIDAKTQRLPDRLTIVLALLALALDAAKGLEALVEGLITACLTFAVFEAVRRGFLRLRGRAGLGYGDVKLAAALALWLGLATPWAIFFAAGLALMAMMALKPASGRLAFGPALALAACVVGLAREAHTWPPLG